MKTKHACVLLAVVFLALISTAVATTRYVNGVTGSDSNDCLSPTTACKTIGHAISLASSGDSIKVAAATYTENLTISINLNVIGAGTGTTIVDGGGAGTVVTINSGVHATLSKLTFQNGRTTGSGGGGIHNLGTLTIRNSTITGNVVTAQCVSLHCIADGGGILNSGAMAIVNSSINGNVANGGSCGFILTCSGDGGGIVNIGGMRISGSTISGNFAFASASGTGRAFSAGGGISNSKTVTISNSTIAGNSSRVGGGIVNWAGATTTISSSTISGNSSGMGGDISNFSSATLQNSIVANSPSGGNCSGTVTSNGYNLSSDATCNFSNTGDMNNTNPQLGPLQNNGGPTQTMALPSGSPAVDAGNPNGCTDGFGHLLRTDQRGKPRPDAEDVAEGKLGCDIGAFERQID